MSSNPFTWHHRHVPAWLWPSVDELLEATPPEFRPAMGMCLDVIDEHGRPFPPGPSLDELYPSTADESARPGHLAA